MEERREPKSGKLHKLGYGLFGPRWSEKWVHLDGRVLKYFSMATDASVFSLSSSRHSSAIELQDYAFALGDDRKLGRKFTFQFVAKEKSLKTIVFACSSERELEEWKLAFQTRAQTPRTRVQSASPIITEKLRRAEDAFAASDTRYSDRVDTTKLRTLVQSIGWQSDDSKLAVVQQQLDPGRSGAIARDRFLAWVKHSCEEQEAHARVRSEQQQRNQRAADNSADIAGGTVRAGVPIRTAIAAPPAAAPMSAKADADTKARTSSPETEVADESGAVVAATILPSSRSSALVAIDWSEEYDALLQQSPNNDADENQEMTQAIAVAAFLRHFREACEQIVRQVVEDLTLTADARCMSELPLDSADALVVDSIENNAQSGLGSASVQKFWANGLLVYMVRAERVVTTQSRTANHGVGSLASAQRASSAALQALIAHKCMGHQLRTARALHDAIHRIDARCMNALRVPLQSTVDYLGFRCIVFASATSSLLSRDTAANVTPAGADHERMAQCHRDELLRAFGALGLMTDSLGALSRPQRDCGVPSLPSLLPKSARLIPAGSNRHGKSQTSELHYLRDVFTADMSATAAASTMHDVRLQQAEFACCKFRPEFVLACGEILPLHSNAHREVLRSSDTLMNKTDEAMPGRSRHELLEAQLLRQAALSASEYLQCEIVPAFVRALEDGSIEAVDSRSLTAAMHHAGVNARYLGLCYSLATAKHTRRLLLCEMIARVCKIELRAALRAVVLDLAASFAVQRTSTLSSAGDDVDDDADATGRVDDHDDSADRSERDNDLKDGEDRCWRNRTESPGTSSLDSEAVRSFASALIHSQACEVVVEFFNLVLAVGAPESRIFWRDRVLPHVRLKFGIDSASGGSDALQSLEATLSDDLVHAPQLFHALQAHTGFAFAAHLSYSFRSAQPLTLDDFEPQLATSAHARLLVRTTTCCEDLVASVDALVAGEQLESALTRLKLHIAILDTTPSDERALALTQLLANAAELSLRMHRLRDAAAFAELAVESAAPNHALVTKAHTVSMKVQHALSDMHAVRAHYAQAVGAGQWHLGASHPCLLDTHMTMVEILSDGDGSDGGNGSDEALRIVSSCVAIARECFGKTSLAYADLRHKQGLLLSDSMEHADEAIGVLEDAANVYERCFCDDSPTSDASVSISTACKQYAATCHYLVAAILTAQSGSGDARSDAEKAFAAARRALSLRREVLPPSHEDVVRSLLQLGTLAYELGDSFRAHEYLKLALVGLKRSRSSDDDGTASVEQIRSVTQVLLRLQLVSLSGERAGVVEKTRKRFATLLSTLATNTSLLSTEAGESSSPTSDGSVRPEAQLLAFVVAKLFSEDASEYLEALIDRTSDELREYRSRFTINLTGSLQQVSAEAPSPGFKRLQSPATLGSRFASFSGVGGRSYLSPPASPSPSSVHPQPCSSLSPAALDANVASPRSPSATSDQQLPFGQLDCSFVMRSSGEFTFGAQLAAVLFLIE